MRAGSLRRKTRHQVPRRVSGAVVDRTYWLATALPFGGIPHHRGHADGKRAIRGRQPL